MPAEPPPLITETLLEDAGGGTAGPGGAPDPLQAVDTVMNEIASTYDPCLLVDKILQTTMKAVRAQRGAVLFADPASMGDLTPCPECGHIHMIVSAPGYQTVGTHLFVKDAPYLDSDAVFAVKDSLIVDFERHGPGKAPTGEVMDVPFYTCEYDFRLAPA